MRRERGAGAAAAAAAAVVAVLLGPLTDVAKAKVPEWFGQPWVIWPVFGMLTAVSAALGASAFRHDGQGGNASPRGIAPLGSLQPPYVVPGRVRGRAAELDRLGELLKAPRGRFAVVCAAGGVGKTTVAAALADRARRSGYAVFWLRWRGPE